MESGHKVVISPRFKRAGQHWAPTHLNPLLLLLLRTTICNDRNDRWAERWPLIWAPQQTATVAARQAAQQQRRLTLRGDVSSVLSPGPEAVPVPVPLPPQRAAATPRVRAGARPTTARRRPTPDHPWRRPFLPDHPWRRPFLPDRRAS